MAGLEEIRHWVGATWSEAEATELTIRIAALGTNDRGQWARVVDDFTATGAQTAPEQVLSAAARRLRRTEQEHRSARESLHRAVRAAAAAGMPRAELARMAGVSRTTVNRVIDGRQADDSRSARGSRDDAEQGSAVGERAADDESPPDGAVDGAAVAVPLPGSAPEEEPLGLHIRR